MSEDSMACARELLGAVQVSAGKTKKAKAAKAKKPVVDTPAHLIPFCGVVNEQWCCGARVNHGLYTQCTKARLEGEDYCKVCLKQSENSASGKPNGGDIRERVQLGDAWRDPKGNAPITFATLVSKPKFSGRTWESAETECKRFGWTIPESERVASVTKRGRPKKVVEVSDTDSEDGDKPKRNRGRPKKQPAKKQELSDLIKAQALAAVAELSDSDSEDGSIPIASAIPKPTKEEKAAAKEAAKLAKKEAAEKLKAEKKAAKKQEAEKLKAEKKAAKKQEAEKLKAEKKAAKEAAKFAKKQEAEKCKAKITEIEQPQLEEEDVNFELGELTLDDVSTTNEVAVEQAMPFNILCGKCFKGENAEYFAMCDEKSFPEPKLDEEGDICLYNGEGEMVATYEDGIVVPLDDEE
jgi:hypothetical protein